MNEENVTPDEGAEIEIHGGNYEVLFGCPVSDSSGQKVIHPSSHNWLTVAASLYRAGFKMCVDLTAVDYLGDQTRDLPEGIEPKRFEVVASFISHSSKERIRARIQLDEENLEIDSLFSMYPGTDYLEREVYDMFGIGFRGHPDLSRILMPEEWQGHPLRKDYSVGAIPVQFKYPQGGYDG